MSEQKHYRYEGHIQNNSKPKSVKIKSVSFLTPARVKAEIDGKELEITIAVDIVNRKIYDDSGESVLSQEIFDFLDDVNSLPEDFFEAPSDIYDQAAQAKQEHDSVKERMSNV